MLRLIVVLLLIGLLMTVLLRGQNDDGAAAPYRDEVERAERVEEQLQESLEQRRRQIDDASG